MDLYFFFFLTSRYQVKESQMLCARCITHKKAVFSGKAHFNATLQAEDTAQRVVCFDKEKHAIYQMVVAKASVVNRIIRYPIQTISLSVRERQ